MIRTILVPLDGSPLAEHGLPPACRIARETNAGLLLVRAVHPPANAEQDHKLATIGRARTSLERARHHAAAAELSVRVEVLPGEPIHTILFAAHAAGADLISMATHGDSGRHRGLLGSVAEWVVRHTELPVLLTRAAVQDLEASAPFRTIVVGLDGTPFAETALDYLQIAGFGRLAEVILARAVPRAQVGPLPGMVPNEPRVHIHTGADQLTEQRRLDAEDYLRSIGDMRLRGQTWRTRVDLDDPATALMMAARAEHADLIVLTTHGRRGMDSLRYGSVAHDLLGVAETPVLILHARGLARAGAAVPDVEDHVTRDEEAGEPIASG